MTQPRAVRLLGLLLAAGLSLAGADRTAAASAAPSASPDPGSFGNLEAWLDAPIPPNLAAGATLPLGLTLWDAQQGQLSGIGGLYLRLHPAKGKARPTEAETRSDWPGHILANVIVPRGGPGAVEVGVRGRACSSDGTCTNADLPFKVAGVGPPPFAPRSALVSAIVHLPPEPAIAGRPMDVVVDVAPRADWDPNVLGLPDRLVVIATLGNGPDLANTEIRRESGPFTPYAGRITIPEAGDVALVIAFPDGPSGSDDVIESATTRVKVGTAEPSGAPAATAPATDGGPAWPLIAGAAAVVLVAGFVIRRVFADL